jgi:hypothetical protein
MSLKSNEYYLEQARQLMVHRDNTEIEQECRALARYYSADEEKWIDYKEILIVIESGRLKAIDIERSKPESIEAFRNYMMNR